jgi:hypothetical protein
MDCNELIIAAIQEADTKGYRLLLSREGDLFVTLFFGRNGAMVKEVLAEKESEEYTPDTGYSYGAW